MNLSPASDSFSLRLANKSDHDRWNKYLAGFDQASFFHQFEWQQILERSFGHRSHFLLAENDSGLCGVLPLIEMTSPLFGHSLSSSPFATYAGALGDNEAVIRGLYRRATEIGFEQRVGAVEFRLRQPSGLDHPTKSLYENFDKEIFDDADQNMQAIRSKQRNIIRKAIKNGLVSRVCDVDTFYAVYAESVRNLGTPVFSKQLFREIVSTFPDSVELLAAYHEDRPVSAAMNFHYGDTVCPYYWGGVFAARRLNGNDFLCWEIINRAAARGCTRFDFGRSKKGTGAHKWKSNLGFTAHQLFYEYALVRDNKIPEQNPNNPKYAVFIEAWKKLPLPVAGFLGPLISRTLG